MSNQPNSYHPSSGEKLTIDSHFSHRLTRYIEQYLRLSANHRIFPISKEPDCPAVLSYNIETDGMEWVEIHTRQIAKDLVRLDPKIEINSAARSLVEK